MHRVFLQWYWIFPFRFFKVFIIRKIISQEQNKDNGKKSHWAWVSRNAWSTDFHRSLHCVSQLARSRGAYFCSGLPGKVLSSMAKIPWTDRRISRLDVTVWTGPSHEGKGAPSPFLHRSPDTSQGMKNYLPFV